MHHFTRRVLFMLLFSVGVGALALATLGRDLNRYYRQRRALALAETQIQTLRDLNADYDGLLTRIETEPNAVRRLVPVVLAERPEEPNAVFPEAALDVLMRARRVMASYRTPPPVPRIPSWVERIQVESRRRALFGAGGGLVLVALLWFGRERAAAGGTTVPKG